MRTGLHCALSQSINEVTKRHSSLQLVFFSLSQSDTRTLFILISSIRPFFISFIRPYIQSISQYPNAVVRDDHDISMPQKRQLCFYDVGSQPHKSYPPAIKRRCTISPANLLIISVAYFRRCIHPSTIHPSNQSIHPSIYTLPRPSRCSTDIFAVLLYIHVGRSSDREEESVFATIDRGTLEHKVGYLYSFTLYNALIAELCCYFCFLFCSQSLYKTSRCCM